MYQPALGSVSRRILAIVLAGSRSCSHGFQRDFSFTNGSATSSLSPNLNPVRS
ncbi:MAG: hypothetical protein KF709_08715 [Gemmatimonadaceae bacterium]|nr:hypothetical protein [Gemmatimonadaceae bacterium]